MCHSGIYRAPELPSSSALLNISKSRLLPKRGPLKKTMSAGLKIRLLNINQSRLLQKRGLVKKTNPPNQGSTKKGVDPVAAQDLVTLICIFTIILCRC